MSWLVESGSCFPSSAAEGIPEPYLALVWNFCGR